MSPIRIVDVRAHEAPMDLLLLADPSKEKLDGYLGRGTCRVALDATDVLGVYVVTETGHGVYELMNIAVSEAHQKRGVGAALLRDAIALVRASGGRRLELGTGTFGHQLTFYQREGFRAYAVARDFFLENYPEPIFELGIQHKDMLRLAIEL